MTSIISQGQPHLSEDQSGLDYRYQLPPSEHQQPYQSSSRSYEQGEYRQLQPINQEYDQNYPHLYNISQQNSQERVAKDPALRPKTSKRVSKSLPPDPLVKQRQRALKNGSMIRRQNDSPSSASNMVPQASTAEPSRHNQSDSSPEAVQEPFSWGADGYTNQQSLLRESSEEVDFFLYAPPVSKKGLVIDRPYSFYKVAPLNEPQSVTVIDSPFGPPEPASSPFPPFSTTLSSNNSSAYFTHPSQSNPFVPPVQFQPFQSTLRGDQSRTDRPDLEDIIPARTELTSTVVTPFTTVGAYSSQEKSDSDRPEKRGALASAMAAVISRSDGSRLARTLSNGGESNQNRQQYQRERQDPPFGGNGRDQGFDSATLPKRKGSGSNILRMARQASDTAFRGMGLSKKMSSKNKPSQQTAAPAATNATHEQPTDTTDQQVQGYALSRPYEVGLGRNRSLPDIKPQSSFDSQAPVRGSSLTNPKSNATPFHSRQTSQHHLNHSYQTPTAMSNVPITATGSESVASDASQDAYGGTTDDWRQAQQAEKEARERENLKDSDPVERPGHSSINSVSTLNLPPTTTIPTTLSLNRSTSRMLLPDRDRHGRGQSSSRTGLQDNAPEPTQGNTSLAKATVQQGGILAQLQAATEAGQVIDPTIGIWSQQEGRYIQRSNTAPYFSSENRTIPEEDEFEAPLEYSKSDGHTAASRDRQQKRAQLLMRTSERQQGTRSSQQSRNETGYQAFTEQPYQQQQHHEQQQENSRARAMSDESAVDTNKDLPPTPGRIAGFQEQTGRMTPDHTSSSRQRVEHRNQSQKQPRSRSGSNTERHQPTQHTLPWNTTIATTSSQENVSSFVRAVSHERTGSHGQSQLAVGQKERDRYDIDLLPLPVIPSPDEPFKKNNVGILPQDVLRTLDSKMIEKIITQSVIASRMYKALSFEELEGLTKEQDDLQKYVDQLKVSLTIETRMRDASHSLIRLHGTNTNIDAVKAATSQLNATTRKMDQIVQRTQNSMERLLVIQCLLLQHEGAVLNAGMRRLDGSNRELSRVVLELEKARDQEKEEKLKWRKEHSQLRIQSMIFPNPPGLEGFAGLAQINDGGNGASNDAALGSEAPLRIRKSGSGRKSPSTVQQQQLKDGSVPPLQQQQHDARLAALEKYMKELNEEITKKDERIIYLESQLRMIKVWADDFAGALRVKIDVDNSSDDFQSYKDSSSSPRLQKQLGQLQTRIEDGFRAMEARAHEFSIKARDAEIAKNKALEFTASTLANTSIVSTQLSQARSSSPSNTSPSESGELTIHSELRSRQEQHNPYRQRGHYNRSRTGLNDVSGLNATINDSLLELEGQILSSSSSTTSLVSSGTPSQDGMSKGRARSPVHQRQDLARRYSRSRPHGSDQQPHDSRDDLVIGDANEEIRRLNAMVDELERLVKLKLR